VPVTVPVVANVNPVGVVYVPLPLTVTVSVSTVTLLGSWRVNVIVPVGLLPSERVAESLRVTDDVPNVTELGLAVVESAVIAGVGVGVGVGVGLVIDLHFPSLPASKIL
jgi:hypothetical protein